MEEIKIKAKDALNSLQINDDSNLVWFEKLEQQTSKQVGYPTPVKTPGGRSFEDVDRYRHSLPKVAGPIREEITEIVQEKFIDGRSTVRPEPKFMEKYDMEYLGGGSFRRVYGFGRDTELPIMKPDEVVLKIAGSMEWTNKEESRVWAKFAGTELAPKLAPVIDIGPEANWLLMKRVDTSTQPDTEGVREFRDEFEDAGWEYHDMKSDNIGWNEDGDKVLVDYGYDWSKRDKGLDE